MTKKEFHQLHQECSDSLSEYMAPANKLCIMLVDCAEKKLTLKQRSETAGQRTLENHLFEEYRKVRDKLLEAARVGYGSMD
jgi:hypothetical protein